MKKTLILTAAATLLLAACQKQNSDPVSSPATTKSSQTNGNGSLPGLADGALSSELTLFVADSGLGQITCDSTVQAIAWFGSLPNSEDAGTLTFTMQQLQQGVVLDSNKVYQAMLPNVGQASANWQNTGSAKFPAFTDTDNSGYPLIKGLKVSPKMKMTDTLTVVFDVARDGDSIAVICSVDGSDLIDPITKTSGPGTGVSFTFLPSELSKMYNAADFNRNYKVELNVVKYIKKTKGSKSYYFIKSTDYYFGRRTEG